MGQISFKIPVEEFEFLKWYAKKNQEPMSTIYKSITLNHFKNWKKNILLEEFEKGNLSIKQICKIGNFTFHEILKSMEENKIDQPISDLVEDYTLTVLDQLKKKQIFKEGFSSNDRKSKEYS